MTKRRRPSALLRLAAITSLACLAATGAQALNCAANYKLVRGECALQQNCGRNAYRSPEGDCYCKSGHQMISGKCARVDKQGFEVAPWKKKGCTTWKAQCDKGNAQACGKYESTCQVN